MAEYEYWRNSDSSLESEEEPSQPKRKKICSSKIPSKRTSMSAPSTSQAKDKFQHQTGQASLTSKMSRSKISDKITAFSTFCWEIEDFSQFDHEDTIQSSVFSTEREKDNTWQLSIYPPDEDGNDELIINLALESSSHDKVKARYTINLEDVNGHIITSFTNSSLFMAGDEIGSSKSVPRSKVMSRIEKLDDILVVTCKIAVNSRAYETTLDNIQVAIARECLDSFQSLIDNAQHSDIVLKSSEGKMLQAHKAILSIRSPVFAAMFSHDMKESRDNEVCFPDLDYSTLRSMLGFIYSGKLSSTTEEEDKKLLAAADKYDLPGLKTLLAKRLMEIIKKENAVELLILADHSNAEQLKKAALEVVCLAYSKEIRDTSEWSDMALTHPHLMKECFTLLTDVLDKVEKIGEKIVTT